MSFSHASPEELLPENPDSQGNSPERLPGTEGTPRQRFPFNIRKLLRTGGIVLLTLSLSGSLIALVVMERAMSDLTIRVNTLDAAFRSGQIGQLTSNVSAMEARLKSLEQQVSTLESLSGAVQSASNERGSLKKAVGQLQETDNSASQVVAQLQVRVSSLEHDAQQSRAELDEINRKAEEAHKPVVPDVSRETSKSSKPRATAAKKPQRSARRPVTLAAPFVLTGIERRGGQTFAVVIPRGVSQISAMRLLSPGDGMLGWTLRSTEGSRTALFMVNGTEHRLKVE